MQQQRDFQGWDRLSQASDALPPEPTGGRLHPDLVIGVRRCEPGYVHLLSLRGGWRRRGSAVPIVRLSLFKTRCRRVDGVDTWAFPKT